MPLKETTSQQEVELNLNLPIIIFHNYYYDPITLLYESIKRINTIVTKSKRSSAIKVHLLLTFIAIIITISQSPHLELNL